MKENKKQAVSLIVLILTIIVMIILSGAIILSLNNSGIFDEASVAVSKQDEAQIKELAQIGYMEAKRGGRISKYDLREAVIEYLLRNGVTQEKLDQLDIIITSNGVSVHVKGTPYTAEELEGLENVWATGADGATNVIAEYDETTATLTIKLNGTDESAAMEDYPNLSNVLPWSSIKDNIESVKIEEGVTSIGKFAFYRMSNLKSVTLPDTLTKISYGAFENTGITNLELPASLTTIETDAFSGSKISSIHIPAGVTNISNRVLSTVSQITFDEGFDISLSTIKSYAFYGNTKFFDTYKVGDMIYEYDDNNREQRSYNVEINGKTRSFVYSEDSNYGNYWEY